jgi:hypothetical protein
MLVNVGQVSTDMYYYACATKKLPGIMVTASHNPKEYMQKVLSLVDVNKIEANESYCGYCQRHGRDHR